MGVWPGQRWRLDCDERIYTVVEVADGQAHLRDDDGKTYAHPCWAIDRSWRAVGCRCARCGG